MCNMHKGEIWLEFITNILKVCRMKVIEKLSLIKNIHKLTINERIFLLNPFILGSDQDLTKNISFSNLVNTIRGIKDLIIWLICLKLLLVLLPVAVKNPVLLRSFPL